MDGLADYRRRQFHGKTEGLACVGCNPLMATRKVVQVPSAVLSDFGEVTVACTWNQSSGAQDFLAAGLVEFLKCHARQNWLADGLGKMLLHIQRLEVVQKESPASPRLTHRD